MMAQDRSNRHGTGLHGVYLNIHRYKGFLVGLIAMSLFSCATVSVTLLKGAVNVFLLACIRAVVMAVMSLVVLILKNIPLWPCTKMEMVLTVLSSLFGTVTVSLQFYCFHIMHPANACAIVYGYITFIALFARIFLKERFGLVEAGSILVTITGVLLIAKPPFIFKDQTTDDQKSDDYMGGAIPTLIAFTASIFSALVAVIIRAIGRDNVPVLKTLFYHSLFCIPITILIVTASQAQWSIPSCILPRMLVAIMGGVSFLGQFCMNYALALENAVYVGLATMNEVYVIFIIDVLFFGLVAEWLNILGMILIVGSSLSIIIKKIVEAKKEEKYEKNISEKEERLTQNDEREYHTECDSTSF